LTRDEVISEDKVGLFGDTVEIIDGLPETSEIVNIRKD